MKEIKFKAIYKRDLEIHKQYLPFIMKIIDDELMFVMEKDNDFRYPLYAVFQDKDWIKLQYTGLKDKNGKEIYSGHILKYKCNCKWEISEVPLDPIDWHLIFSFGNTRVDTEIIGNIYENPELITEGIETDEK